MAASDSISGSAAPTRTLSVIGYARVAAVADACRLRAAIRDKALAHSGLQAISRILEDHPVEPGSAEVGDTTAATGNYLAVVLPTVDDAQHAMAAVKDANPDADVKLADWCSTATLQAAREQAAVDAMTAAVRKATLIAQVAKSAIAAVLSVEEIPLPPKDDPRLPTPAPAHVAQELRVCFALHSSHLARRSLNQTPYRNTMQGRV